MWFHDYMKSVKSNIQDEKKRIMLLMVCGLLATLPIKHFPDFPTEKIKVFVGVFRVPCQTLQAKKNFAVADLDE